MDDTLPCTGPTPRVMSAHVPASLATELRLRLDAWLAALTGAHTLASSAQALTLGPERDPQALELVRRSELVDALSLALDGAHPHLADATRDDLDAAGYAREVAHLRVSWVVQRSEPHGWRTVSTHRALHSTHDAMLPGHTYRVCAELTRDD